MRGYEKSQAAIEKFKINSKPFSPSPEFEDKPIPVQEVIKPLSTPVATGNLRPFEETQELTIPQFPEQPSWTSNWNSEFGLKLNPPTTSKKVIFEGPIFDATSRIKVNPIGTGSSLFHQFVGQSTFPEVTFLTASFGSRS